MSPAAPASIAVISDVHGNRWALEAVLRDIERRGVNNIVNLGDCLYGPLDPAGTADILLPREFPTVRGNEDRIITENGPGNPTLDFVRGELGREQIYWLAHLPETAVAFHTMFMCHGSPASDTEYLLHEVKADGASRRSDEGIMERLGTIDSPVIACGHDHLPFSKLLPDGRLVVDPGSVGLPAYTDDAPFPHAMEAGSPHARYRIVFVTADGWQAEGVTVEYDVEAAAEAAERNGRPDWARWLRTGRA